MKTHYERRRPHILPPGAGAFFTFCLADSLPVGVIRQLAADQEMAIRNLSAASKSAFEHTVALENLRKL